MAVTGEQPYRSTRRMLPVIVFVVAALVTGLLDLYLIRAITRAERAAFDNEVSTVRETIEDRLLTIRTLLRGTVGLFRASDTVAPNEFRDYVDGLDLRTNYPGILGLAFSVRIPADSPQTAQAWLTEHYGDRVRLWPDEPRAEYHAIVYIEPLDARNQVAVGYDMFTHPVRREAMAAARDSGARVATGKLELVQEITREKQSGMNIYMPVYREDMPLDSVEARRAALIGFVYSPLRIGDLLGAVRGHGLELVDFEVYDGTLADPTALLYSSRKTLPEHEDADVLLSEQVIRVGGRPWLLRFHSRPGFDALSQTWLIPWLILLAVGSTALLTAISWIQSRARRQAELAAIAYRQTSDDLQRQREWLQATLSSIGDGVIAVDADQCVVSINPVAERLTGWRRDDAIGTPLERIVVADVHRGDQPSLDVDGEGDAHAHIGEITLIARDGLQTPVEHSTAPIRRPDGSGSGAVIVLRDVTERREHESALQASEERERERSARLQQLAAAIPRVTATLSIDALVEVIETTTRQLLQAPAARMRLDGDADAADGSGLVVELTSRTGERVGRLEADPRPGRPYGSDDVALLQQLAGIAAIAVRNVWLYEELRVADRRKDEFLATLAHELRNPLAPICTSLELMRIAPDGPNAVRAREVAERQARHMVRLIDDLLDLSRISRGAITLQKRVLVLADALDAAIETAEPLIRSRRHRLVASDIDRTASVDGDPARLAQIFANLLNNAAHYTEPGGEITVVLRRAGAHQVEVSVRDTGIGIEPDHLPQVFDMFMQADRPLGRSGGLGIGLTLVQRLARMHGGSVEARSAGRGHGAEFIVRLPLAASRHEAAGPAPVRPQTVAEHARRRLLVVDDNRDAAESLALMLRLDGYQVATAHDGMDAVDIASRIVPDAVLLDIGLPGIDGYEVAQRLRAERGRELRLIALTGWGQQSDRDRATAAGFDVHMVKPVEYSALRGELDRLLAA